MRKLVTDPFQKAMATCNAAIAMNSAASKGFSKWANKDIKQAAESGDWSVLLDKASKSTIKFRNEFYK